MHRKPTRGEHGRNKVLANVVHVGLYGCHHDHADALVLRIRMLFLDEGDDNFCRGFQCPSG